MISMCFIIGVRTPLSAKPEQTVRQPADGFVFTKTGQNLFCEGHEKNKTYRKAGLFRLCKVPPKGSRPNGVSS